MDIITLFGVGGMIVIALITIGILVNRSERRKESQNTPKEKSRVSLENNITPQTISEPILYPKTDVVNTSANNVTIPASPTKQMNSLSIIIIILLIIMGLFWLTIGFLQLGISGLSITGLTIDPTLTGTVDSESSKTLLGYSVTGIFCGATNIIISVINLLIIRDVVKRNKRVIGELTFLGIGGSIFGMIQLFTGSLLQACAIPLYIILAVLAQINKQEYIN